jgi:nitroreductase
METIETIKLRRSVRKFKNKKIPHDIIEKIIDAAIYSPSWRNTQAPYYYVIEDYELKSKLAIDFSEWNQRIIDNAPIVLVITCEKNLSGSNKDGSFATPKRDAWRMFDCGIATQTIVLAAFEYGIGSVIMGIFDPDNVSYLINLPSNYEVIALVGLGYPDEQPIMPKRKSIEEVLTYK